MNAQHVLTELQGAGISVFLTPDRGLAVTPASRLTQSHRELVKCNKAALIELLQRLPEPANDATPAPAKTKTRQPSADWSALDKAYQRHHFACPTCIAAGKGYGLRCGVGAALWASYDSDNMGDFRCD